MLVTCCGIPWLTMQSMSAPVTYAFGVSIQNNVCQLWVFFTFIHFIVSYKFSIHAWAQNFSFWRLQTWLTISGSWIVSILSSPTHCAGNSTYTRIFFQQMTNLRGKCCPSFSSPNKPWKLMHFFLEQACPLLSGSTYRPSTRTGREQTCYTFFQWWLACKKKHKTNQHQPKTWYNYKPADFRQIFCSFLWVRLSNK